MVAKPTIEYVDLTGRAAKSDQPIAAISINMSLDDKSALKDAADIISKRAKELGRTLCRSSRIPRATHVDDRFGYVMVITEGDQAPNAAPFEGGEDHPLWAHEGSRRYKQKWGQQPYRPYMLLAAVDKLDEAAQAYGESVYAYARKLGWQ